MRWILCLITLSTFLTQQIVCCCATEFACASDDSSHDRHQHRQVEAAPQTGHCQHSAAKCGSHSSRAGEESESPSEDDPAPHSHHLCVGTHVFYRTVAVTTVPAPWVFAAMETADLNSDILLLVTGTCDHGKGGVLRMQPPRSLLGVLLI